MKRYFALAFALALVLAGCGRGKHAAKNQKTETSGTASIVLTEDLYAMILPNEENAFDDREAEGYAEIMEKAGRNYVIERPKGNSAQEQRNLVRSLKDQQVSCIAVAPKDADSLTDVLQEALEAGADVCSFDRPASPDARELHINPAGTREIAETLMDAVLDLTGGSGQWAVLTVSAVSDRQNGWAETMKSVMKDDKYKGLELLEIAYGNDVYQMSFDQSKALLQNYPDLRLICSTSPTGLLAACDAAESMESDVMITGLGLPSQMKGYIGKDRCCPYFFLRNPVDTGRLAAYVSIALHSSQITGELGESFIAEDLGEFLVTEAPDKGTEVIVGAPVKIDEVNLHEWTGTF